MSSRLHLRSALALGCAAGLAATAACGGGDDATSSPGAYPGQDASTAQDSGSPKADASVTDSAPVSDAFVGDVGSSQDAEAPEGASDAELPDTGPGSDAATDGGTPLPPPASVIFLHASPNIDEPLRLCWVHGGTTGTDAPFPSDNQIVSGNYPGIPVGGAVWLTDPDLIASLQEATLWVVRAVRLATPPVPTCEEILTGTFMGYKPGLDYWRIGPVERVMGGGTQVVAISGCRNGDTTPTNGQRCGLTWDPVNGNLHADVVHVGGIGGSFPSPGGGDDGGDDSGEGGDDAQGDSGGGSAVLHLQAAHFSPGLAELQTDGGAAAVVSFGPATGGTPTPVAQLLREDDVDPYLPNSVLFPPAISSYGSVGFAVDVPGAGSAAHVWMSLAQSQELVSPTTDPAAYFGMGGTYLVAVVGDPGAPHAGAAGGDGGGYNGVGLHVLVLPPALH